MEFNFNRSILSAAAAGLMLGALSGCASNTPAPDAPTASEPKASTDSAANAESSDPAATAGEGKSCCKAMNECQGKGGCKTDANECAGKNQCKGKGGCNAHCPK